MRAGTTTLYYDLLDHPEICMASVKEPNFFVFDGDGTDLPLTRDAVISMRQNSVTDLGEYQHLFRDSSGAKALGDVSPSYLYSALAARRLSEADPSCRLIVVLRNPVDRAYSAYLRRAQVDPDPEAFLAVAEQEQIKVMDGERLPLYPLILGGLYSRHLGNYLSMFSRDQLLIIVYEEFWPEYPRSLRNILEFIGVSEILPSTNRVLNQSGIPRSAVLDRLLRGGAGVKSLAKRYLPNRVVQSLVAIKQGIEDWGMEETPTLPDSIRAHLHDRYFSKEVEFVESVLERDFPHWR